MRRILSALLRKNEDQNCGDTALSINPDGSGNLGPNTVAVTNGTVLYFIDETGNLPHWCRYSSRNAIRHA